MAKDKKEFVPKSFEEMGGVGGVMDSIGTIAGSTAKVTSNLRDIKGMDAKGNAMGKKDVLGNALSGAQAGKEIGKYLPIPGGEIIGATAGAAITAAATVLTKPPSLQEQLNKRASFDLGISMQGVRSEDTFSQQQLMAEKGMKVTGGKTIEVERDEIVLQKVGKSYKKVADFKGGKNHVDGGEQYNAQEGDIIIPGAKRALIQKHLRLRDHKAISSVVAKLPVDVGQEEFGGGTKKVTTVPKKGDARKARWDKFLNQPGVKDKVAAIAKKHGFSPERLMAVMDYETSYSLSPAQRSKSGSSATGLLQFMDATAKELGTTTDALAKMDTLSQLNWVEKYYDKHHKYGDDPYDTVIASGAKSFGEDHILYAKGSDEAIKNPSWQNENGDVTKATARNAVRNFNGYTGFTDNPVRLLKPTPSYETYAVGEEKAGRTPKSKEWYEENVTAVADKGRADAIKKNEEYQKFNARMESDTAFRGMYNVGDAEGMTVQAGKKMRSAMALPGSPTGILEEYFSPGARVNNLWQDVKGAVTGQDTSKDKINLQEIGYTDKKLAGELDNFVSYLQHDADITWLPADIMRGLTALQAKVVAGQDVSASIPNAISEIISGSTPEQLKALVDDAEKKGILKQKSKWIVNNIAKEPQKYWTSQMTANLGFDIATLVANPKGIVNMFKAGGKFLKAAGSAANLKKLFAAAKKLPGATAKVFKAIEPEIKAAATYKDGESVADLIALGKNLDAAGVPLDPALGVKSAKSSGTWSEAFGSLGKKIASLPDAARKSITGKSYTEINAVHNELMQITGKTSAELIEMGKTNVGKLLVTKTDDITKSIETAIKVKEDALVAQKTAKQTLTTARAELAELRAVRGPKANEVKLEKALQKAEQGFADSTEVLNKAYNDDALYTKNWEQIAKLEAFESSPAYRDKFRTLVKLEAGIGRHLENLDELGDTPEALKAAITKHHQWANAVSEGVARVDNVKDAAGKVVAGEGKLIDALNGVTDARGVVTAAGKGEKAALNAAVVSEAQLAKVPGLMKIVSEDAALLKQLRSGTLAAAQIANIVRERGGDSIEVQELEILRQPEEAPVPEGGGEGTNGKPRVKNIDGGAVKAVKLTGVKDPKTAPVEGLERDKVTVKESNRPKIGDIAKDALGSLAEYAPAFYNLAKGMRKPDKVDRDFVSPQTKEYKNMSQPQLNMIDDAFNTATGNARNTSGGMMSNFRSNIEKAWADKLKRGSEVNAMEAQRADQVASENIGIRNQANQMNTQLAGQYNQVDMQSKAATGQFLAQGMQDLANIRGVHAQDKTAKANQDMMLKMMGAGRMYDPLTGEFIGPKDGRLTTQPPVAKPATAAPVTTPFVAPVAMTDEEASAKYTAQAEALRKEKLNKILPAIGGATGVASSFFNK